MDVNKLVSKFDIEGEVVDISYSDTGNINRTFIITVRNGDVDSRYILQKINTNVFNEPYLLMKNIESVTQYCKHYLEENNGDVKRGCLNVIRTKDGKNLYRTSENEYYRMYDFVENARTYDKSENAEMFYNVGIAFGRFVRILNGYPMNDLYETIPNFHNSKSRYNDFIASINKDPCDRVKDVFEEINFIIDRKYDFSIINDLLLWGSIPLRVTHNDTKINNVLIDNDTNEAVCVIDLDTVMPGTALYDFGDAIRSGAALTYEDDTNLNNVGINLEFFEAFTEAYLSETNGILTDVELDYLVFSCKLLTLELAMRFLTDYINGDTYFKCNYDKHNLDRCRNQIELVKDIERNINIMTEIVNRCRLSVRQKNLCKKYVSNS